MIPSAPVNRSRAASAGVNILVSLAAALCVLCAWQWVVQSKLRVLVEEERQNRVLAEKKTADQEAQAKRYSDEITRLEALRKDLEESTKTNKAELNRLRTDVHRLELANTNTVRELEVYKGALATANDSITKQNESVKAQNEQLKKIVDERNDYVNKYNKLAEDYNKTVTQYNQLVDQVKKEREAQQAAAEKDKK